MTSIIPEVPLRAEDAQTPRPRNASSPMPAQLPRFIVMNVVLVCASLAMIILLPRPVDAELVVLAEGSVIKVEEYRRDGDRVFLLLPSGGRLELPLIRIERVVEDEIDDRTKGPDLPGVIEVELEFLETHGVPDTPFGGLIYETARRYGINPHLVAAVVRAESAFDPYAVSSKGASGLLQLMPATAQRFGLPAKDIFDPKRNLDAGVRYMSWLSERFDGSTTLVLAGYNAGEVNVDRYEGVPPFRETQTYIRRIYSALGGESGSSGSE